MSKYEYHVEIFFFYMRYWVWGGKSMERTYYSCFRSIAFHTPYKIYPASVAWSKHTWANENVGYKQNILMAFHFCAVSIDKI